MKANRMVVMALVCGLIFAFSNLALGNGVEPPSPVSESHIGGIWLKGKFIARKYEENNKYKCKIVAGIEWIDQDGTEYFKNIDLYFPQKISEKSLCDYTRKDLVSEFEHKIKAEDVLTKLGIAEDDNKILYLHDLNLTGKDCDGLPLNQQKISGNFIIQAKDIQQ
jgi:hypothetical protein